MSREWSERYWVFPTHVGVNRSDADGMITVTSLPHARGGEPTNAARIVKLGQSSPRTWG